MAGVRHTAPSAEARAGRQREARSRRDLCEGEGVELRRDLVRKPGAVVLLRVRPRPFPVTAVVFSVRLCPLRVGRSARTRVGNVERLRGESLARRCDRALGTGPARTRYARLAVAAPALQHGLAARCTRGRYECERFRARGVPRFARIRPWFRRLARRRTKRRRRGERRACAPRPPVVSRLRPDRCVRGATIAAPRSSNAVRNACARCVTIGATSSRQRGSVSARSCVSGARMRHTPLGSSTNSREATARVSQEVEHERVLVRA